MARGVYTRTKPAWNFGIKTGVVPSTAFKKGHSPANKGKTFSEESRKKMSMAAMGRTPWNKGTKGLQVAWNKGLELPQLSGENHPMFGKTHTEESKKKMSASLQGKTPWNKGDKLSAKHIENLRISHIGKRKGAENHNWKGGITPIHNKIRASIESKLWIQAVFARDGYTCQKTGVKGGRLTAHHIMNFSQYPELRFAIDNGVTLSVEAHNLFHKLYGKKNNTREQLQEFLAKDL